jgi:hypothetical protein
VKCVHVLMLCCAGANISRACNQDPFIFSSFDIDRAIAHSSGSKQLQVRKALQNVCRKFGSFSHATNDLERLEAFDEGISVGTRLDRVVEYGDVETRFNTSPVSTLECHPLIVIEYGKTTFGAS